jgi:tRNA-dihydrouridine synthase
MLGSGDLFSAADCLRMLAETGVDGVTIARGCIGNPWIFQQCRALAAGHPLPPPPTLFEQREVILEHYRLAEQIYGPERAGALMRKFGIKYAMLHPQHLTLRQEYGQIKSFSDWQGLLARHYSEDLPGQYPDESNHVVYGGCENQ